MELLGVHGFKFLALILCSCNFICAGEHGGFPSFIRNFCIFAGVITLWFVGGTVIAILPCRNYVLELCGYALVGFSGLIPFTLLFIRALRRKNRYEKREFCFGILAVLIYNGVLFFLIGDTCLRETYWTSGKLFQENLLDVIYHFSLPGILLFLLAFIVLFLILGALQDKFSGFLKNVFLISGGPFFAFAAVLFGMMLSLGHEERIFWSYLLLLLALGILLYPGAVGIIRGVCRKDKLLFYNGLICLGSSVFFVQAFMLLVFAARHV